MQVKTPDIVRIICSDGKTREINLKLLATELKKNLDNACGKIVSNVDLAGICGTGEAIKCLSETIDEQNIKKTLYDFFSAIRDHRLEKNILEARAKIETIV